MTRPLQRYEYYAARAESVCAARARRSSRNVIAFAIAIVAVWAALYMMPLIAGPQGPSLAFENASAEEADTLAVEKSVYFRNCAEAWAADKAPIYEGQPGYRPELDGNSDGIACEPYPGKRP